MSAKRLSTKELLAERNPLARPVIAPVDIYDQINEEERSGAAQKSSKSNSKTEVKQSDSAEKVKKIKNVKKQTKQKKPADPDYDPVGPYSTYLKKSQVKKIKHRAVDNDVKDQHIVQAAIDEYFARHP